MAEKQWRQRCGQCGRSYKKATWRRVNFWCPTCTKFVCYDCVTRGMICPACGTMTNRKASTRAVLFAMIGIAIMYQSSIILLVGTQDSPMFWIGSIEMAFGVALIGASFIFRTTRSNQVKMHEAYISELPQGLIPIEDRPGYGNHTVYKKWRDANISKSSRESALMKETYPDYIYFGLKGDWDFPVLTKEERISMTANIQTKALHWGVGIIGFGIVIMLLGLMVVWNPVVFGIGLIALLVGLLAVSLGKYARRLVQSDAEGKVNVSWKTVGFAKAKGSIEEFLREQDIRVQSIKVDESVWPYREYKYILPDETWISFVYGEDRSGRVYGWVTIGYKPSDSLAAKRLQRELDDFLSQADLIRRAG